MVHIFFNMRLKYGEILNWIPLFTFSIYKKILKRFLTVKITVKTSLEWIKYEMTLAKIAFLFHPRSFKRRPLGVPNVLKSP